MSGDRGYTLLLNHIHNPATKLPLKTIQGALSHHLATLSPSPTPLAATAISAPFFLSQPITDEKLNSLSIAFRHATHLKYRALVQAERKRSKLEGLFKPSILAAVDYWAKDVVKGLQGGHPVLRLACCSGLLLSVDDLTHPTKEFGEGLDTRSARGVVEDESILALAEVMDTYAFTNAHGTPSFVEEWEKEFQPAGQDLLSLALIFASQSFPLISQQKLKVLPLPILAQILTSTISTTFKNGTFLSAVSASVTLSSEHLVHISPSSAFAQTLQSIMTSPLTAAISSISRFTANVLSLLLDAPSSHLDEDMRAVSDTLNSLREIAKTIEKDWISTSLASVTDAGIAPDSKEMAKSVWTLLKTLLFTIIMVSDAALSTVVFLPPANLPSAITPSSLALQTLHTLSHLAFVASQFGGVTSTSKGFEELKKTFYLSLDILAQGEGINGDAGAKAEAYVEQACIALNSQRVEGNVSFRQAKQAYTLASIEQLVPVLSDKCIRNWVWGVCYPHLYDASHRETFESSHSVILAIFASHAQQHQQPHGREDETEQSESPLTWLNKARKRTRLTGQQLRERAKGDAEMNTAAGASKPNIGPLRRGISTGFVQRMVPFYARCLIENSVEGRLSTSQLRMAYSALVRSACACSSAMSLDGAEQPTQDDTYSLGWYCVQTLLDTLRNIEKARSGSSKGKTAEADIGTERVHRLHLTLISTISSLPLLLLSRLLPEIYTIILSTYPRGGGSGSAREGEALTSEERRKELVEALFREILEGVGDREKEFSMTWWYIHRFALVSEEESLEMEDKKDVSGTKDSKGNGSSAAHSRL
ncbi:hypothetical protein FA15DRAFT_669639 [Coprinopsis marcescibilis]|uniref:Peroxisomal membrane protein n=1 Tax=Coprinopsis marcescibilis TaxID=230819 RepID=A0A5C3KV50_COPMA|nr:hypothetical protein FA15DRAFT_669639 [Coprinopsis marcescibilis]